MLLTLFRIVPFDLRKRDLAGLSIRMRVASGGVRRTSAKNLVSMRERCAPKSNGDWHDKICVKK
jgi:hypothetical protein